MEPDTDFEEDWDKELPPVPSSEYRLKSYPIDYDDPSKGKQHYIAAEGSPWTIGFTDENPTMLNLSLGDMGYHDIPLSHVNESHNLGKVAEWYDETGAAADIKEILDATRRLHPHNNPQMNMFGRTISGRDPVNIQMTLSKWHIAMGGVCPQCGGNMVGNDCPGCGYADQMGSTDMNYQNPGTGLSPNPDMPMGSTVSGKVAGDVLPFPMRGTHRCNCETNACEEAQNHTAGACPNDAADGEDMDYVGPVCRNCAETTKAYGGGQYLHPRGTVSKWHILSYGEVQQPGGVATPPPDPEQDPNYLPMDDVAPMSSDQEMSMQTLVNTAVEWLNKGMTDDQVLAYLIHDFGPSIDAQTILQRAKEQPLNTDGNLQDTPHQQPPMGDAMTNNSGASGLGDSVSQPPAFNAKVKGTSVTGKIEAEWEDLYGQKFTRIRTATGTHDVLTGDIESEPILEVDPVNVINELINHIPPMEQTKASVHQRISHLKEVAKLCRKAMYSNPTNEQLQKIADIEASTQTAILNLTDEMRKYQPSLDDYLASQRKFHYDGYGLEEMLTAETTAHVNTSAYDRLMDEHPKLVVHDLSDAEKRDAVTVRRVASDYISQYTWELPLKLRQSMNDEFVEAALAEARKFKPAPTEKTAAVEEPIENWDGPAASLFI